MPENSDILVYFDPRDEKIHILTRYDNGSEVQQISTVENAKMMRDAFAKAIADAEGFERAKS